MMRLKNILMICPVLYTLAACSPIDGTAWDENALIHVDWSTGNEETGKRPTAQDGYEEFFLTSYPQADNEPAIESSLPFDNTKKLYQPGKYDFMVTHDSKFIIRKEMFKTAAVSLPVEENDAKELVITDNPDKMLYAGLAPDITMSLDTQTVVPIKVIRLFKKLNFVAVVGDKKELLEDAQIDLSGLAYYKVIWNQSVTSKDSNHPNDAVLKFPLKKRGRFLNNTNFLTAFQGCAYVLGTGGNNILYFTFTDAQGKEETLKVNLTSYLSDWNTEEVTVRLDINVYDNAATTITVKEWENGNTTDVIFDY